MSVIGFDLDGTLAEYKEWKGGEIVGKPRLTIVKFAIQLSNMGHTLCIWSTRADYVVKRWLKEYDLIPYFKYINCSPYPTESGKASFDFYIGDDALNCATEYRELLSIIIQHKGNSFTRDTTFSSHNPVPYFQGVGIVNVNRFEDEWRKVWSNFKSDRCIAFMTICSHAKPYSKSFIHTMIRKKLHDINFLDKVDYIHISNAGIIPAKAEMDYPFNAYDWDGTLCSPEVKAYHIEAIKRRFKEWLIAYGRRYERIIIYLRRSGNTFNAIDSVVLKFKGNLITLIGADDAEDNYPQYVETRDIDDCLTSHKNLDCLDLVLRRDLL